MSYDADAISRLQARDRYETRLAGQRGIVKDLERDNVIVHVGNPIGSVTGWVGTIFWQVWVDPADAAGTVHARIGEAEPETWEMEADAAIPVLLDMAKDRVLEQAHAAREARLAAARKGLAALSAT
ncbi:hypothetical protein [Poseidonocella sp. HB161398]|uniref:hypothetical protein n=1 Tax=Poseidonocella sp. HB161398 TaxID=2320855 RepID=UPI001108C2A7|nr:hypothetical protein [Poseidonocella sp. HB161398]